MESNSRCASLYVGDLRLDVTNSMLYDKFGQYGRVKSIRVCRDRVTKQSLGYAYVNFVQPAHAQHALDKLNYEPIKGRPCRIMWSQRDPYLRRSGVGNLFIKNLHQSIDSKALYDAFSTFGNILSCKVETGEDEISSKGFGFVHFDTQQSADRAIQKLNGTLLHSKKVYVGKFIPRKERNQYLSQCYTNVYVKNFGKDFDRDKLVSTFDKFGKITSAVVMKDENGQSRGFGFVNYETHDAASKAVETMNGSVVNGRSIYCGRAQKKKERQIELRRKREADKMDRYCADQRVTLYIKNLDDELDEEQLRKEFAKFGKIISTKVITYEDGRSKGYGFVCISSPEAATKAIVNMNGRIIVSKPLYVALAQRKEERVAHLSALAMQRIAALRASV